MLLGPAMPNLFASFSPTAYRAIDPPDDDGLPDEDEFDEDEDDLDDEDEDDDEL